MHSNSDSNLIKSASYCSIIITVIILAAKVYGWLATDSQSLLASLIDSMLDISSSFINLLAIRLSLRPPDNNHRFGHEKFQDLAIFSQSIFFFASSIFTIFSSTRSLFGKSELSNAQAGIDIMYFCLVMTFVLVCYQTYVIRKTKSKIIEADKLHYFSDFLANLAVIASLYLSSYYQDIDALAGIGISIYILVASYSLLRIAIRNLADEEFPDIDKKRILSIIGKHTEVKGVHELKTRFAANKPFIQFHLELAGNMTLLEAHEISDRICDELLKEFPGGEITVHQDPEGLEQSVSYKERL